MIKVVMERHCKPGNENALASLLVDLRTRAMRQPGYVTGETLIKIDEPTFYFTIGTWTRIDAWHAWEADEARFELTRMIDGLLSEEPKTYICAPVNEGE